MTFDRDQIKAIVREILTEILLSTHSSSTGMSEEWVDLKKAWNRLGYPSYQSLHRDVQRGLFRQKKELRDRRKPGAKNARWQIDIVAAGKRLKEDPSKRRSV
jgi:hypothetical protein